MSLLPEFEYDVFISYAHLDNIAVDKDPERHGWVAQFGRHLLATLMRKVGSDTVSLFRDKRRISGNQLFDQTIQDAVRRSAVLVALTSTGYLKSDYCRQELELFFQKALQESLGLAVGDEYRIFNVLLSNVAPGTWPKEYGRTGGFRFHEASEAEADGDVFEIESASFNQGIFDLSKAILSTLTRIGDRTQVREAPTAGERERLAFLGDTTETLDPVRGRIVAAATLAEPARPLVFMADTTETLDPVRGRIIEDLKSEVRFGATVPPPLESELHDAAVRAELQAADLSVHLLGERPGRRVFQREGSSYPQRQLDLALAHGKSQLVLMPQGSAPGSIEDPSYAAFLDRLENGPRTSPTYHVQREWPSAMAQQVRAQVERLKEARAHADAASPSRILLDTHVKDQLYAVELGGYLRGRGVDHVFNPQEDDPAKLADLFTSRLKRVGTLIIFYGSVSADWVRERLRLALHIAVDEGYPLKACGVYMAPPLKVDAIRRFSLPAVVVLEWMDHTNGFNADAVDRLLARAAAARSVP